MILQLAATFLMFIALAWALGEVRARWGEAGQAVAVIGGTTAFVALAAGAAAWRLRR